MKAARGTTQNDREKRKEGQNLREMGAISKGMSLYEIVVSTGEDMGWRIEENIFEEMTTGNFLNLIKTINS